jgi:hypothetical protein
MVRQCHSALSFKIECLTDLSQADCERINATAYKRKTREIIGENAVNASSPGGTGVVKGMLRRSPTLRKTFA